MYTYEKHGFWKHFDFYLADLASIIFSFIVSFVIRHNWVDLGPLYRQTIVLLILFFTVWVLAMEPYHDVLRRGLLAEIQSVFVIDLGLQLVDLLYLFLIHRTDDYSRQFYLVFVVLTPIIMLSMRVILKSVVRSKRKDLNHFRNWILVTEEERIPQLVDQLMQEGSSIKLLQILAVNSTSSCSTYHGVPVVADYGSMWECLRTQEVEEVLISLSVYGGNEFTDMMSQMVDAGFTIHLDMSTVFIDMPGQRAENIYGINVLTSALRTVKFSEILLKRVMDIIGAIVGLLITAIVSIAIVPMIKLDSPGPIIFKQKRIGKNGRTFYIYKFRSMYVDAEEKKKELMAQNKMQGLMFKMDDDPRITKVGKFIRRTSIDELPQFWNILKGDMSLVGTRPPTVDEYQKYELHHKRRLSIKPGLTGMWQISGRSDITNFEEVVKLDTEYIMNWSLWMDIKILWKTVFVVLFSKGAV